MSQDLTAKPIAVPQTVDRNPSAPEKSRSEARTRHRAVEIIILLAAAGICFGHSLLIWAKSAWRSELYSYTLMIPFISGYLAWSKGRPFSLHQGRMRRISAIPFIAGFGLLGGHVWLVHLGWQGSLNDHLALEVLAFLCFATGGGVMLFSADVLRRMAFPMSFLIFMVPPPDTFLSGVESFLQHRSADVAQFLFSLAGTPVLRQDTVFQLPGFTLEVGPECSGIHSTLVLFITSLVAGYLLLQSPWRRALLTLSVIPLGLLRNGFRILTIGELCVNVSPDMINSYIHRRGGPIFFALSLIPFFLLLVFLRKGELKPSCGPAAPIENP